jgi:hypothetical protein
MRDHISGIPGQTPGDSGGPLAGWTEAGREARAWCLGALATDTAGQLDVLQESLER